MPFHRFSWCFLPINIKRKSESAATVAVLASSVKDFVDERGFIIAALPSTRQVLRIFEPTILPMIISGFPFFRAVREAANSGRDVPSATIVNPIIDSLTPKFCATFMLFFTTISPPSISAIRPPMVIKVDIKSV